MTREARQGALFPTPARRVRMHVCDAGAAEGGGHIVRFECHRCGHDAGWHRVATVTEGRHGVPCPRCNARGDDVAER